MSTTTKKLTLKWMDIDAELSTRLGNNTPKWPFQCQVFFAVLNRRVLFYGALTRITCSESVSRNTRHYITFFSVCNMRLTHCVKCER